MELNEFITKTLTDLAKGVWEAQKECVSNGAYINPSGYESGNNIKDANGNNIPVAVIEFEIGLTISEGKDGKGGIGVTLGVFDIKAEGGAKNEKESINNIKFSIPVALASITSGLIHPKVNG